MAKTKTQKTTKSEVKVDRRASSSERRSDTDRRAKEGSVPEERRDSERRKTPRRRQIDPTTCERDYTDDEIEFMHALEEYKRRSGRMFPTCSEILEVMRDLGYRKLSPAELSSFAVDTIEISADALSLGDAEESEESDDPEDGDS